VTRDPRDRTEVGEFLDPTAKFLDPPRSSYRVREVPIGPREPSAKFLGPLETPIGTDPYPRSRHRLATREGGRDVYGITSGDRFQRGVDAIGIPHEPRLEFRRIDLWPMLCRLERDSI
jgi:hypothetical protein